jgi:hypothetical protein
MGFRLASQANQQPTSPTWPASRLALRNWRAVQAASFSNG